MADDPEIEKLLALLQKTPISGVPDLIRQAYRAGMETANVDGQRIERALRQAGFIRAIDGDYSNTPLPLRVAAPSPPAQKAYGSIMKPVRIAMRALAETRGGVDAQQVLSYMKSHNLGSDISLEQVRTALKVLAKRDEARRLKRGKYAPGPKLKSNQPEQAPLGTELVVN